jgi:hypothetical protein
MTRPPVAPRVRKPCRRPDLGQRTAEAWTWKRAARRGEPARRARREVPR